MKSANLLASGSHSYAPSSPVAAPVATERPTALYFLPSGEPVRIYEDVARGAGVVGFTLADGTQVNAVRAVKPTYTADDPRSFDFTSGEASYEGHPFGPPAANDRIRTRRGPR